MSCVEIFQCVYGGGGGCLPILPETDQNASKIETLIGSSAHQLPETREMSDEVDKNGNRNQSNICLRLATLPVASLLCYLCSVLHKLLE